MVTTGIVALQTFSPTPFLFKDICFICHYCFSLFQVEEVMKLSLRTVMAKAVEAYPKEARKVWVLNWPGQVVLAASIVHWTTEVTNVNKLDLLINN